MASPSEEIAKGRQPFAKRSLLFCRARALPGYVSKRRPRALQERKNWAPPLTPTPCFSPRCIPYRHCGGAAAPGARAAPVRRPGSRELRGFAQSLRVLVSPVRRRARLCAFAGAVGASRARARRGLSRDFAGTLLRLLIRRYVYSNNVLRLRAAGRLRECAVLRPAERRAGEKNRELRFFRHFI